MSVRGDFLYRKKLEMSAASIGRMIYMTENVGVTF